MIRGLSPDTFYYFRITMGDKQWGYNDVSGSIVSTTTYISPATGLRLDESTTSTLKLSWTPSALAEFYAVYTRTVGGARAVTDGFDLFKQVDSSTGSVEVTGLKSGGAYEVLVLVGKGNETEQVGARLVATTKSSTDNIIEDPGLGANGTVIAAASAAAVVALIVVAIVVFVIIRRRQKATNKLLNEFGGTESMVALNAYRREIGRSQSSMSHADKTIHLWEADKTVMNTTLEIALPGFLLVDYAATVQSGARVVSDAGDNAYYAAIIDPNVATRIGMSRVVMRNYEDIEHLSAADNTERFHHEVSIMWSLSFHPNVVCILAYTNEPRAVMTRAFKFDLARFVQETPRPMPANQMHRFAANIATAVSAMHTLSIAHRNIQSANIFVQEPSGDSPLHTALLGGFSQARSEIDDGLPYLPPHVVNVRYAAPEVLQVAHSGSAVDCGIQLEFASDVFSLGVVLHELATGKVPWGAQSDEAVRNAVLNGATLVSDAYDSNVPLTMSGLIKSALAFDPPGRPSASIISAKLTSLDA